MKIDNWALFKYGQVSVHIYSKINSFDAKKNIFLYLSFSKDSFNMDSDKRTITREDGSVQGSIIAIIFLLK